MKIGIDVSQIVHPGGVGVYTRNLVNHLLQIDSRNDYVLFGSSLRKFYLLKQQFKGNFSAKYYHLPPFITEYLFNQLRWPKIEVFTGKLDIFHTSDWMEPKTDCAKVTTVHDLAPLIYPKLHDKKIVKVFKQKLSLVKKESSLVIAVSTSTKKDLIEKVGIEASKIRVIYEAVDKEYENIKPDNSIISKYNLKQFIISDGLKNQRKNLITLLKAFDNLNEPNLQLVLPGQALWGSKEIQTLIDGSKFKHNIIMPGTVTTNMIKALNQKAMCAVMPSFYEGFGLAVLEAMTVGCPVITSNISSLPEVGGSAAILINPHNAVDIGLAIRKIKNNEKLRLKLKDESVQQAKIFSWEKAARETLEVYKEIVNS